jgi:hypothetical protein
MNINRATLLVTCVAVILGVAAEPAFAKKKKTTAAAAAPVTTTATPNPASEGYPNGRPWQAVEGDFTTVMNKLQVVEGKVDSVKADTVLILSRLDAVDAQLDGIDLKLDDLNDKVDLLAGDVSLIKNTLSVQVSVVADDDRVAGSTVPVTLFVQVSQNGAGLSGLTAADFGYVNGFGAGVTGYCGAACFVEGGAGVYAIRLQGTWGAESYAGNLTVSADTGSALAQGTSLVTFDVPAPPAP